MYLAFFLSRNGRLYGKLGAALFPECVQPVTDGGQNIVMPPSVPSLVKCDWATNAQWAMGNMP